MTLYLDAGGDGWNDGYAPDGDQLPLYLNRPNESESMTLFLHNVWTSSNTYTSLHMVGVLGMPTDTMTLAMPEVIEGRPNTYTYLHTVSGIEMNDNTELVVPDPMVSVNDNITLVVQHDGGPLNAFTSMYVFGVLGIEVDNVTLAMPDVIELDSSATIVFIKGY
jgi:hypothetical protein